MHTATLSAIIAAALQHRPQRAPWPKRSKGGEPRKSHDEQQPSVSELVASSRMPISEPAALTVNVPPEEISSVCQPKIAQQITDDARRAAESHGHKFTNHKLNIHLILGCANLRKNDYESLYFCCFSNTNPCGRLQVPEICPSPVTTYL